ncbi:hypothetical protein IAU60_003906 [Kwoniella sp. DSM 27419]
MLNLVRPAFRTLPVPMATMRAFTTSTLSMAKKKAVDPTLPIPPRGPPSAYTLFFKKYVMDPSNAIKTPEGKLNMPALATNAGSAWNNLSTSEKSNYESEASSAKKSYESEYKAFWDSTTAETRAAIFAATGKEVKPPGGKKAYKKSIADRAGNPGKPLNPYLAFAKEVRDGQKVDLSAQQGEQDKVTHLARETGKLWKELDESEKQKYKDQYTEAKAKWDEWKSTQSDL